MPNASGRFHDHKCNAWCSPPEHAHVILVMAEAQTEEDILALGIADAYYALHTRRIVRARKAPEVDKAQIIREKAGQRGVSTQRSVQCFTPAQMATMTVWLIHFVQE